MFCTQCGAEISSEAKFCSNCGDSVKGNTTEHQREHKKGENTIYYDNGSGISVDSRVYNVNGSIFPINQISSIEIRKNHTVTQETLFLYGACFGCIWGLFEFGSPWFFLGLLGPIFDYYAFQRVRWIFLKSGGSSERMLTSSTSKEREELFKIKNAVTAAISENS